MGTSRHFSRVITLQALFSYEFNEKPDRDPEALFAVVLKEFQDKALDTEFAKKLFMGVLENRIKIRELITEYAPQWPIAKIAPVDRAILELAFCEMVFTDDVPDVVVIDEAIELAKSFGNDNAPKFINGVLNALLIAQNAGGKAS
ncbi:transcription antitermination factor NusB [Candidatus Peregrinibacteria bacterium CG_4_9_14_0_2_um_filter_53_11]|nr:MAG: transcription antitermination factor NusB [Candidatus Peregrinibacteria bacterium CG_4_9_14_0_2_um_filter_53_11]